MTKPSQRNFKKYSLITAKKDVHDFQKTNNNQGELLIFNDAGQNVTVNGDCYSDMIKDFFVHELHHMNVGQLWFQQDGTTCHTALATINLLKKTFCERIISRFGRVNWPAI